MSSLDLDVIRDFVQRGFDIDALEEKLAKAKAEREALGAVIVGTFQAEAIRNIPLTVSGKTMTVYVGRSLRVGRAPDVDAEELIATLLANPVTKCFVKPGYNAATLGAFVREQLEQDAKLDPELTKRLSIQEEFELRAVTASTKESSSSRAAHNWKRRTSAQEGESTK